VDDPEDRVSSATIAVLDVSHVDHGLTPEQLAYVLERVGEVAESGRVTIETVTLREDLGFVDCALYGPIVGDEPIAEERVIYERRGARPGESRLLWAPKRLTRQVTAIVGPHGDHSRVLYTAFGGPLTPREPWDPTLDELARDESVAFWREHALAVGDGS
jgi:hypothetical protein